MCLKMEEDIRMIKEEKALLEDFFLDLFASVVANKINFMDMCVPVTEVSLKSAMNEFKAH